MALVRRFAAKCALGVALMGVALLSGLIRPAHAQIGSDRYSSIVIDARTGNVLSAVNADEPRFPASLTKMMTIYMLFEALRDRRIDIHQLVPVSAHAASMAPTKLGLVPGTKLTVEQALLGLVTKSANDAAAALGELMGGDEERFAQMMTLRARALGMTHTQFRNASGLPDPNQVSTAHDMAILARHLILDFPAEYHYFSTPSFVFHGRVIANHDRMLVSYPGADGLKTGYTDASGLNLVTSAVRDNVRLIGVVFGASNGVERDRHMTALLDAGYERLDVPVDGPRQTAPLIARLPSLVTPAQAASTARVMPTSARARMIEPERPRSVGQSRWAVQVGSFTTQTAAHRAALAAHRMADAGDVRLEQTKVRGHSVWRAQISGLTRAEAQGLCSARGRKRAPCSLLRPDASEVASR